MNYDIALTDLISTLTKSEKRYFKIDAGRHIMGGENNYVKLFDLFEKQENHSKAFAKTPSKNLSATKRHLYQFLLKSMRAYSEKNSGFNRINAMLGDVYNLYTKGLNAQCSSILEKAKKIAYSYERFEQVITIIYWQKIFAGKQISGKEYNITKELRLEEQHILNVLEQINKLESIEQNILNVGRYKGYARTKEEVENIHLIMKDPVLQITPKNMPLRVNIPYYVTYSIYYGYTNQMEESYKYRKKITEMYESKPLLVQEYFKGYLGVVHNLMVSQRKLKMFSDLLKSIHRLREAPADSSHKASSVFSTSYHSELNLYINRGEYKNAMKLVPEIEKGLKEFRNQLSNEHVLIFQFNIAYLYFASGQFKQSLRWLNYLLQHENKDIREDMQASVRILSLIIHYELGHTEVISYYERAVTRFLTKKRHLLKTEKAILDFVGKKIHRAYTRHELRNAFIKLKSEILGNYKDPIEKRINEDIDILSWIESKIQQRSFADCVRRKLNHPEKDEIEVGK